MFEKTRGDLKKAIYYCASLVNSKVYDPRFIRDDEVPEDIGVYLWKLKRNGNVVYVGQALGEKGLYQRIVKQHLNKSYKGVLKDQVMSKFNLSQEQAVTYLKNNLYLSFIKVNETDRHLVNLIEVLMINEFRPKYNRAGK